MQSASCGRSNLVPGVDRDHQNASDAAERTSETHPSVSMACRLADSALCAVPSIPGGWRCGVADGPEERTAWRRRSCDWLGGPTTVPGWPRSCRSRASADTTPQPHGGQASTCRACPRAVFDAATQRRTMVAASATANGLRRPSPRCRVGRGHDRWTASARSPRFQEPRPPISSKESCLQADRRIDPRLRVGVAAVRRRVAWRAGG
jgi:hypothetical protein